MWQNIALLAIGFSGGLLAGYSFKKGPKTINAETYYESQTQEIDIARIKQKKSDGEQSVEIKPTFFKRLLKGKKK